MNANETATFMVAQEIVHERNRQDAKWGQQNHPDGTGVMYSFDAKMAKNECQLAEQDGADNWALILLEEVYEALAETDPARVREELIQTAAVAAAWVEAIDRRTA